MIYLWMYLWGLSIGTVLMILLTIFEFTFRSVVGRFTNTCGRFISSSKNTYDASWIIVMVLWPVALLIIIMSGVFYVAHKIGKFIFKGIQRIIYIFLPKKIKEEILERSIEISLGVVEENKLP